jgi:nitrile hydratase accessory protein
MNDVDREIADARGSAAPPRKNGELVFNAPWEGRAFGMALAVRAQHRYSWRRLQSLLERRITAAGPADDGSHYYEHWIASLEDLLVEGGLISRADLDRRTEEYLAGERDQVF